jgi:hypothetical protein
LKGLPSLVCTFSLRPRSLQAAQRHQWRAAGTSRGTVVSSSNHLQDHCASAAHFDNVALQYPVCQASKQASTKHNAGTSCRQEPRAEAAGQQPHLTASCTDASMTALSVSASTTTAGSRAHRLPAEPPAAAAAGAVEMAVAMLRSSAGLFLFLQRHVCGAAVEWTLGSQRGCPSACLARRVTAASISGCTHTT